jgi:hypothetical protein
MDLSTTTKINKLGSQSIREIIDELTGIDIDKTSKSELNKMLNKENKFDSMSDKACSPASLISERQQTNSSQELNLQTETDPATDAQHSELLLQKVQKEYE